MKNNEMGRACSTYGERRAAYRILVGRPGKGDHLEDPGIDGGMVWDWGTLTRLIWLIGT